MSGIVNQEELDKPILSVTGELILERTTDKLLWTKFTEAKVLRTILRVKSNSFLQWTDRFFRNEFS